MGVTYAISAPETGTMNRDNRFVKCQGLTSGHGTDVVADQRDRASGQKRQALIQRKQFVRFGNR